MLVAAMEGHDRVAELLLKKDGIQPNLADPEGTTPLGMAAEERHGKIVEMLLRKDEVRAIGWDGWRPMRRKRGQPQLANGHAKKQRIH